MRPKTRAPDGTTRRATEHTSTGCVSRRHSVGQALGERLEELHARERGVFRLQLLLDVLVTGIRRGHPVGKRRWDDLNDLGVLLDLEERLRVAALHLLERLECGDLVVGERERRRDLAVPSSV